MTGPPRELTRSERAAIRRLVTGLCANYDEREKLFCGLPPREDDPPVELHILYQPGAETMQEGDEEGAERELAAVEREAKVVAARIHELVGTPFYDAKTETERPLDRKSTRLNSSHNNQSRMPSSA